MLWDFGFVFLVLRRNVVELVLLLLLLLLDDEVQTRTLTLTRRKNSKHSSRPMIMMLM